MDESNSTIWQAVGLVRGEESMGQHVCVATAHAVFSFVYAWSFPFLVPLFAIAFPFVGPASMWRAEEWFYSWNSDDQLLFTHFREMASHPAVQPWYRLHPFFAAIALISSYQLAYNHPLLRSWVSHERLGFICLCSSTLMALFGRQLVPTMYSDDGGKFWTLMQAKLVIAYNALSTVAMLRKWSRLHRLCGQLTFSLLLCAGVGERAYVLFVLPFLDFQDEDAYLALYSIQFRTATTVSWLLGACLFLCTEYFAHRRAREPRYFPELVLSKEEKEKETEKDPFHEKVSRLRVDLDIDDGRTLRQAVGEACQLLEVDMAGLSLYEQAQRAVDVLYNSP